MVAEAPCGPEWPARIGVIDVFVKEGLEVLSAIGEETAAHGAARRRARIHEPEEADELPREAGVAWRHGLVSRACMNGGSHGLVGLCGAVSGACRIRRHLRQDRSARYRRAKLTSPHAAAGRPPAHGCAASKAAEAASTVRSAKRRPTI